MVMGRPRLFETPEEFIELSDAYFEAQEGKKISWTGLCLAVGADSRRSLDRYRKGEHGDDFVSPIKRALMVVENYYEEKDDGAKSIFIMKNFDWKDKTEVDLTTREADLTEEQLEVQIKEAEKKLGINQG